MPGEIMNLTKVHFAIWETYPDIYEHFDYYQARNEKINTMYQENKTNGLTILYNLVSKRLFSDEAAALEYDSWLKLNVPNFPGTTQSYLNYTEIYDLDQENKWNDDNAPTNIYVIRDKESGEWDIRYNTINPVYVPVP